MTDTSIENQQAPADLDVPLVDYLSNGIPRPTGAFLIAQIATTLGTKGVEERYRQMLRDALTIAESMDYETLRAIFSGIGERAREIECRQCFGMGDIRIAGRFVGDCPTCDGTGLKP